MVKALFDTNILIDYLNGERSAEEEFKIYKKKYISIINYIEVLVGVCYRPRYDDIKGWLMSFNILEIDQAIADLSIDIRVKYKLKIPDALMLATAHQHNITLITRNTKDFNSEIPLVRIPYLI